MSTAHARQVDAQFGPQAKAYVESAVHARGPDLDLLDGIVESLKPLRALDLGAGGGHVSYLMAAHADSVTAVDLSAEMIAAVEATAGERGLGNIEAVRGRAESIPFEDGTFDFAASRYSAHHWQDFEAGLREARRVVKPGSCTVFMDAYASETALFDTHLQAVELLRDTSHVRDRSIAEWIAALSRANFSPTAVHTWRLRMDFPVWIARMRTPDVYAKAIRALQDAASAETKAHFAIEPDGSFMLDTMAIEVVAR